MRVQHGSDENKPALYLHPPQHEIHEPKSNQKREDGQLLPCTLVRDDVHW